MVYSLHVFSKISSFRNWILLDFHTEINIALQNVMPMNSLGAVFLFCTFYAEMSPLINIFHIICVKNHSFLPIFTKILTKFTFTIPLRCWFWCLLDCFAWIRNMEALVLKCLKLCPNSRNSHFGLQFPCFSPKSPLCSTCVY